MGKVEEKRMESKREARRVRRKGDGVGQKEDDRREQCKGEGEGGKRKKRGRDVEEEEEGISAGGVMGQAQI